ncbi:MAG: carboxymuconolactone decarboxylase family protein [Gaiellaceae bacterium]
MGHLPGTADDIRGLVPAALEAYAFTRDEVLRGGVVDPELKELCFRYLAEEAEVIDLDRFDGRERAALEWAHAIAWDSARADDALWERLHELFSDQELVELGCAIGFELGQQHWRRTVGLPARD